MRVIATVQIDLEMTPLGTRSRLAEELRGIPVLRRTIERLQQISSLEGILVLCPSDQRPRCVRLLDGTSAEILPHDAGPAPWASLVRSARKWSLDAWRGGVGGTTVFDEFVDARLLDAVLTTHPADAVLVVPPGAVVLDPDLNDRLIGHRKAAEDDMRLAFTPVPPGLAGIVIDASLVHELAEKNVPAGWLFSYQPDAPRKDLIFQSCCLEAPAALRFAGGRLIADTQRSLRRLADLLGDHPDPDAETVGAWLLRRDAAWHDPLPHEVEIELTTDDPYPEALLRPRGERVGRRGPLDVRVVQGLAAELSRFDDSLVVLGGFGEPLLHPRFADILEALRPKNVPTGVFGLCVRTTAVALSDENIATMVDHGVDILNVVLDAWSPELYGRLHAPSDPARASLQTVLSNLDRLTRRREQARAARPIVVPEFTKARDNVHELDDFHDGWLRRIGAVSVTSFSHHARQCDDRSVMSMSPDPRFACRRIRSRCLLLADGRVTMCDQDFRGDHTVGRLGESDLSTLWTGTAFNALGDDHRTGGFDRNPLCAACDDWHRP